MLYKWTKWLIFSGLDLYHAILFVVVLEIFMVHYDIHFLFIGRITLFLSGLLLLFYSLFFVDN